MKTVTIAVKEPSKAWEIREVEDTLKSYKDRALYFTEDK